MDNCLMLNIAKEFSTHPAGRTEEDGPYNGTSFRENFLRPKVEEALRTGQNVCVSLAGLMSFGSSFFEEAFGGLVRGMGARAKQATDVIVIEPGAASNERYKLIIQRHITKALSEV